MSFFESWCGICQAEQPDLSVVLVDQQGRIAERFQGGTTGGTLAAALAHLLGE